MDRTIWKRGMKAVHRAAREVKVPGRRPKYPHWLIVAMYLWAVMHDRCLSWAADRSHYNGIFRPRESLPSISQFTRRIKTPAALAILQRVHEELLKDDLYTDTAYLDGKPLLVSPVSKDPDASRGKISGGFAKGYKLHVMVNSKRRIVIWSVMPLNVAEQSVAMEFADQLPAGNTDPASGGMQALLLMADSNYDSAPLHKKLAAMTHNTALLLTPLKGQQRVGEQGHHPVTLRQMGAHRREAVQLWRSAPGMLHYSLRERNNVEGVFSVLCVALGLGHLPAFVRTLPRVCRWVGAKIILYHARLLAQEELMPTG